MRQLATAIALSFLVAACGTPQREPNVLDRAAANAAAAGSARSESVSVVSWGDDTTTTTRSVGAYDYLRDRMSMTYETETDGKKDVSRLIAIGSVIYIEWDWGTDSILPPGKPWLRVTAESDNDYDGEAHACDSTSESSFESEDWPPSGAEWEEPIVTDHEPTTLEPGDEDASGRSRVVIQRSSAVSFYLAPGESAHPLDSLAELGSEITTLGREVVRSEPTTHYRARLDPRAATRKQLEKKGWKEESIACTLAAMPPSSGQYDVWIDDDGLVRRTRTTTSWRGDEPMASVDKTEFFDYGSAVTIAPPPADQVVDEDDLADLYDEDG